MASYETAAGDFSRQLLALHLNQQFVEEFATSENKFIYRDLVYTPETCPNASLGLITYTRDYYVYQVLTTKLCLFFL